MDRTVAAAFYREAKRYAHEADPELLDWFKTLSRRSFRRLTPRQFMEEYAWVVYASGFSYKTVQGVFPRLRRAFKNFDLDKVARMRTLAPVLSVFRNKRKARFVREGARTLVQRGFGEFKRNVLGTGPDALAELPGVGPITKNHLARNVGLASVAKNDRWIARLVRLFDAETHDRLASLLAREFRTKPGVVDYVLWKFCADRAWEKYGAVSLQSFVRRLRVRGDGRANRLKPMVGAGSVAASRPRSPTAA